MIFFPDLWWDPSPVVSFSSDLVLAQSLALTSQLLAVHQGNG